jgi:hypothetical protein
MNPAKKRVLPVAQAACCFNCLMSKQTPFFQMSKVMAAILRAKVSRAIAGFMPLAMRAGRKQTIHWKWAPHRLIA